MKSLNQAVFRNIHRFPDDFMFRLTDQEFESMRSQFVTSRNTNTGGNRYTPRAFTEHGILMFSAVLRSKKAIDVSISIVRIFNRMRKILESNQLLMKKLEHIEKQIFEHSEGMKELWFEFKKILHVEEESTKKDGRKIGFETV